MYASLKATKALLTRKPKIQDPRPDNFVFRMHYQFTFGILGVAVVLISSYSYIDTSSSAIQCMMDKGSTISGDVINRYCWMMSTYSLTKHYEGTPGGDFIHHGVGPQVDDDEKVYHAYYQWVPLFLSFQAICFYLPHFIWKQIEGGRFKNVIAGLNSANVDKKDLKLRNLKDYLKSRMNAQNNYQHKQWAAKFYFCEFLNFVNVIFQLHLTDIFLGGAFSNYGLAAAGWTDLEDEDRIDPLIRVFPRMTKCTFHKFGGSGTIERFDALCVLGMNIINEKVFVFLWFWFVILAVVSGFNLVLRVAQYFIPSMRARLIKVDAFGLNPGSHASQDLEGVLNQLSYQDWLLIYYLAQSMDKGNFALLVDMLHGDMEDQVNNGLIKGKKSYRRP